MKILIADTYYIKFLDDLYRSRRVRSEASYTEQMESLMGEAFGTADFYSRNLIQLGHSARELVTNCKPLQFQWAKENLSWIKRAVLSRKPDLLKGGACAAGWQYPILFEQIKQFQPDVVHFQDPASVPAPFVDLIKPLVRLITGQISSPYRQGVDFSGFDLMFSAWPHYVQRFRDNGLKCELWYLGFESAVLDRIRPSEERDLVFVGSLSSAHQSRIKFLERLAAAVPFEWWGPSTNSLDPDSPLHSLYKGSAWGLDMLNILAEAKICLNQHIDEAGDWANNMRLFEATGVGTMLLTDRKSNLNRLFKIGSEALAYSTHDECLDLVNRFLTNAEDRRSVAIAGQQATLTRHNYRRRMEEYLDFINPWLNPPKKIRASNGYMVLDATPMAEQAGLADANGWLQSEVARRQKIAYEPLLADLAAGRPRQDLALAAEAVRSTRLSQPRLLEIGCGNGYYSQVFRTLIGPEVRYTGLDYSRHMTVSAFKSYPTTPFITGDAVRLPVRDNSFDIVFNGVSLMHIPDYKSALSEGARAARSYLILHTIPVCQRRGTTYMIKEAYGGRTVEIVFNWAELVEILSSLDFKVTKQWDSIPYDLNKYLGEPTNSLTLLCRKKHFK